MDAKLLEMACGGRSLIEHSLACVFIKLCVLYSVYHARKLKMLLLRMACLHAYLLGFDHKLVSSLTSKGLGKIKPLHLLHSWSNQSAFCFTFSGIWLALQWYKNFYCAAFVSKGLKEKWTARWTQTHYSYSPGYIHTCNSYTMGTSDLPDIYTWGLSMYIQATLGVLTYKWKQMWPQLISCWHTNCNYGFLFITFALGMYILWFHFYRGMWV